MGNRFELKADIETLLNKLRYDYGFPDSKGAPGGLDRTTIDWVCDQFEELISCEEDSELLEDLIREIANMSKDIALMREIANISPEDMALLRQLLSREDIVS